MTPLRPAAWSGSTSRTAESWTDRRRHVRRLAAPWGPAAAAAQTGTALATTHFEVDSGSCRVAIGGTPRHCETDAPNRGSAHIAETMGMRPAAVIRGATHRGYAEVSSAPPMSSGVCFIHDT